MPPLDRPVRRGPRGAPAGAALVAILFASGCASTGLEASRARFHSGQYYAAAQSLDSAKIEGRDRLLYLMERGTMRQAAARYEDSARDFIDADTVIEQMVAVSVTRDTASLIINDLTQEYQGAPFERTLVHTLNALNHFALGHYENAGVEARRILKSLAPDRRRDYPDDAFSRYVAGLCFQLLDDPSNGALQFREAAKLAPHLAIDDATGRLRPAGSAPDTSVWTNELVCFVLAGQAPWSVMAGPGIAGHAELVCNGQTLGRSHVLTNVRDLARKTAEKEAAWRAAKTAARIVVKDQIAKEIGKDNDALGLLAYLILFGLEQPDTRRWETLPALLQVARVPCPADPRDLEVVFYSPAGMRLSSQTVMTPITHRRNTWVTFVRDLPTKSTAPLR